MRYRALSLTIGAVLITLTLVGCAAPPTSTRIVVTATPAPASAIAKAPNPDEDDAPPPTPTPTAIAASQPSAEVKATQLNLRSGPSTDYSILTSVSAGDELRVIGQYDDCAWLQVSVPGDDEGWVAGSSEYVMLSAPCMDIPAGHFRPLTGVIQNNLAEEGRGELVVENETPADGVAILTSLGDRPVMAAYVRSDDSVELDGIPDGVYRLYFSKGEDWDGDEMEFTKAVTLQRFEDTFPFETTASRYTIWTVTLHAVAGGDARTEGVDPDAFPSLK